MTKPSFLDVLDACYRLDLPNDEWVAGLADAALPLLDAGLGTAAFVYRRHPSENQGKLQVGELQLAPRVDPQWLRGFLSELPPEFLDAWEDRPVGTMGDDREFKPAKQTLSEFGGAKRVVSLNGRDLSGYGVWLGAPMSQRAGKAPAIHARVASHLASAARLRRREAARPSRETEPDAVLRADGKLEHASDDAKMPDTREALRRATVALDRARSAAGRSDPERSITEWRTLVAARWSLVDRFDSDGRHYIIAAANAADVPAFEALSARERQVVACAALGHHNKLIAYELGLSDSTVRVLMFRAASKLGAKTRAGAIAAFLRQAVGAQDAAPHVSGDDRVVALRAAIVPPSAPELLAHHGQFGAPQSSPEQAVGRHDPATQRSVP